MQDALWLRDRGNPPWVEAKLAEMAPETVQVNVFSWNRRLARYVKAGQHEKTIQLFQEMRQKNISPNSFTFVPVLNACASLGALQEGRQVHEQIIRSGCEADVFVGYSLVDMYAKCRHVKDAWRVFKNVISRCGRVEHNDIGACEMWARAEGTGIISTNAAGRCTARLCYLFGGAECMCQ